MAGTSWGFVFKAGLPIVITGTYLVTHPNGHRASGLVELFEGAVFPACPSCDVIYTLQDFPPPQID